MGGGKGTVTPLLKGKVQIPPPAGHFIDLPCPKKKKILTPLCSEKFFSMFHVKIIKNVPQKCKNVYFFNKFIKSLKKCMFGGSF